MGCKESKHAVATASTTVAKSKSKRSSDSNIPPPLQNASNESVSGKENEIPDAISIKKEAETTENGEGNTLADQENIGNAESGEENPKTSSDGNNQLGLEDCAGGGEEEKPNSCSRSPRPNPRNHEEESVASAKSGEDDPATKNGEGKADVEEKESPNAASTRDTT